MANNIVLKTYKGGNVTPQDDAIIHDVAIATNGVFKGCEVSLPEEMSFVCHRDLE